MKPLGGTSSGLVKGPAWLILLTGCAAWPVVPELPQRYAAEVGPFWILSDRPIPPDSPFLAELESLPTETARALDLPLSNQPIRVYLFDGTGPYRAYLAAHYPDLPLRRAYFMGTDEELVVMACWTDRVMEDLRHELTHALLHAQLQAVPLWLDEGLAEYFESPGGWNSVLAERLSKAISTGWQPELRRLESLTEVSEMGQDDYRDAWAWVHFLLTGPPPVREVFRQYVQELRHTPNTGPLSARLSAATPQYALQLRNHVQPLVRVGG